MPAESLSADQLRAAFRLIAASMKEKSELLRELDAACGDGDLGITVSKGFTAIEHRLDALANEPPSRLIQSIGMTFNNAAASTFGVFFATAFMHAGKSIDKKGTVTLGDISSMLGAAADGIATRGRAKVGDRTILDALVPAQQAAEDAADREADWPEALAAIAAGAQEGAESTRDLLPKHGRARWLGEQVKGIQDPGATFVQFFLEACRDAYDSIAERE